MSKKKQKSSKISEFIQDARDRFKESYDAEAANRELGIKDTKHVNGDQWGDDEKVQRAGRPCLTINKLSGNCKQIIGDARQNRPRIKVRPEDSVSDPMTAMILTGLIRNIENVSDAESAYDNGLECAIRGAIGYWRVTIDYSKDDAFDQDILIQRIINQYAVYYDQSSVEKDYSDAGYCFIIKEMKREEFEKKYPDADSAEWEKGIGEADSGWFSSETVRVAEYWYKEPYTKHIYEMLDGKIIEVEKPREEIMPTNDPHDRIPGEPLPHVIDDSGDIESLPMRFRRKRDVECNKIMFCKMTGNEVLEKPEKWPGKYIPIIPCLGEEMWINGKRVLRSAVRDAIEPQKLYNWARSNNMETMALAPKQPWIVTPEQITGFEEHWDNAYATPKPYLLYNHIDGQPPPQRLMGSVGDHGANQEAMLAADDIKATTGIYDASLGARGNETSGKAINARQRQGDTATFVFPDNQVHAIKYTGKILIDLISKVHDGDRVVRLMGDDLHKKFSSDPKTGNVPWVNGKPTINVSKDGTEAWARINFKDPHTGKIYHDMSVGKYDAVIDAGPGYNTKRQEATDGMLMIAQAAPGVLPVLLPRIAKNADWPEAQELGDELKAMQQQGDPGAQAEAQKGQIEMQKGQLDLAGKKMDLQKKLMEIQQGKVNDQQQMYQIAQKAVADVLKQIGLIR